MAEIIIKGYYGKDYVKMVEDVSKLWGFSKINTRESNADTLFFVNNHTFLRIIDQGKTYAPIVELYQNNKRVGNSLVEPSFGSDFAGMCAIRTNSATLLSFRTNTLDLRQFPQECVIFSDAEHHKLGVVKPVASMFRSDYSHYICAEDAASKAEIKFSPSSYYSRSVTYNADITVFEPFVDTRTTTSLKGVYTLATSQMPIDFIGECTLNGRSYYSYNRIFIEDN